MAASQAEISYGITVDFVPDGGASSLTAELTDIEKDSETTDQAEVSHQESPNQFKEFLPGFVDGGVVTLSMNFNPDDTLPNNRDKGVLTLTVPWANKTKTKLDVPCNVQNMGQMSAPLGDKCSSEIAFKVTGPPVWSTPV